MNDTLYISPEEMKKTCVAVRWEAETVYLIADFIREGIHPSEQDLDRLALTMDRIGKAVVALGGDKPVALKEAA